MTPKKLMRTAVLFLFACFLYPSFIHAQIGHSGQFPDVRNKKGALIAINEMHGVTTVFPVYLDILKNVNTQLQPGDSINLFLEIPYSCAVMLNDFLANKVKKELLPDIRKLKYPSSDFIDSIRALNIPVKIFGCDFEYDKKYKRNLSFTYILEKLHADWAASDTDLKPLATYIQSVKDFQISKNDTRDLRTWLQNKQTSAPADIQNEIGQVLFVLEAPQGFSSGRDEGIYERVLKAVSMHYYDVSRLNLLIHGIAHVNPTYGKSLFNLFRNNEHSPFANNCYLIGNVYLDCKNNSGIFNNENISSMSFYPLSSDDAPVVDYFRKKNIASGVTFMQPPTGSEFNFPGLKAGSVLGIYVHNKIID